MLAELVVGDQFAGHRIERLLGRGGMGVVYLAEHLRLGRKVAIKLLSPNLASDDAFRRRFIRESQAAAALEHPNIVPVYDAGEIDGVAFISMRYVGGSDLGALLRSERFLAPETAIAVAEQVASALDAAHAEGLVHRDVKPANILLERDRDGDRWRAFLADFGITKQVGGPETTEAGQFLGTIDYMAPEQITGGKLDGRTDQYSLACVLFQCLTGEVPFPRAEHVAVLYGHLQEPAPRTSERRPALPARLDAVIQRGMAKRPDRRFETCSALVGSAARTLGTGTREGAQESGRGSRTAARREAAAAAGPGAPRLGPMRRGRRLTGPRVAIGALIAVILAAGLTGVLLLTRGRPDTTAGSRDETPWFPTEILWHRVPDRQQQLGGSARQVIERAVARGSKIVAVGYQGSPGNRDAAVWVSGDAARWQRHNPGSGAGPGDQVMEAVADTGTNFVAVGTNSQDGALAGAAAWLSDTGDIWRAESQPGALGATEHAQAILDAVPSDRGLVAVGWDETLGNRDAAVWRFDGSDWTEGTVSGDEGDQQMWGVAPFGPDGFVAVGSDSGDAAVWTSPDGEEWDRAPPEDLTAPGDQVMRSVANDGAGFVAVGSDARTGSPDAAVWTSGDAIHWREEGGDRGDLGGPGLQEMTGVITFHDGLIAVGVSEGPRDRDAAVWLKRDGSEWTLSDDTALGGPGNQAIADVIVFHTLLVAVGRDNGAADGDAAVWIGTPTHTGPTSAASSTAS
jgi:predicted Ser/Thr protein kinase